MIQYVSIDDNLRLAAAMADQLADFLLSKEVFWPLDASAATASDQFPKLSLGAFLFALDQLASQANAMSPEQIQSYRAVHDRYRELAAEWQSNLAKKAQAEMRQRANLWRAYLSELGETPQLAQNYTQEVKNRFMLERLKEPAEGGPQQPELEGQIDELDRILRARFRPGNFIWEPRLKSTYPDKRYWFLFGRPKS